MVVTLHEYKSAIAEDVGSGFFSLEIYVTGIPVLTSIYVRHRRPPLSCPVTH